MAALPAGVQYGLSSESSYKENKELLFVKLTDSALKAIEDFLRNNRVSLIAILLCQNKISQQCQAPYLYYSNWNEIAYYPFQYVVLVF